MHQRKGKKVIIYFFLLLLVGSINNINLSNLQFKEIKDIKVAGLDNQDNQILLKEIKDLNLGNIYLINKKEIINQINSNSLVEKYNIFKRYPSSLEVNIEKTKFLAKINHESKIFIVGSNGKLSKKDYFDNQLPYIFGKPNIEDFLNFKKIIDQSKFSYEEIKNLYFFSSKRWDIELNDNKIIKLPNNNVKESLDFAYEFLYNSELKDINIIDVRIKNQIILND